MTSQQPNAAPAEGAYSIRAVQRVCDLLDLLQQEPEGATLVRAAEFTKLPKSSAFRYLATLEERRYVERDPETGAFRLGLALLPMQARQLDMLTRRARPHLERLQAEFEETANLGMLDGQRVIYLDMVESPHAMRLAARPGDRDALHATALGKALAAQLAVDQVRAILKADGMPKHTDRTITTQREYLAALETVRDVGYALDDGENEIGARCVAVALPATNLPLAISISAPAARLDHERVGTVAERLKAAAAQLAVELAPTNGASVGAAS
ncbi:MAG: IclR family transcriptional regulator, acetate operon repressor [Solirubrobacteraceae bacterium]